MKEFIASNRVAACDKAHETKRLNKSYKTIMRTSGLIRRVALIEILVEKRSEEKVKGITSKYMYRTAARISLKEGSCLFFIYLLFL